MLLRMVVSPEQQARRRMSHSQKNLPAIKPLPSRRVLKASPKENVFFGMVLILVLMMLASYNEMLSSGFNQNMEDASAQTKGGSNNNNNDTNNNGESKGKSKRTSKREKFVEQLSVVYQGSNSTDWCQSMDDHYSTIHDRIPTFNDKEASVQTHKKFESLLPNTGMYLVKIPKAGSSTSAAVSLQIAEAIGKQKGFDQPCPHHIHHGHRYTNRESPNFFLWSAVRKPHLRAISSYFFFEISRGGKKYNSTELIKHLDKSKGFQLNYLTYNPGWKADWKRKEKFPKEMPGRLERIHDIFRMYDFIAVAERMDESLVVLKLLFGFPDEAMIAFSSKRAGGFDDGGFENTCAQVVKAETTLDVDMHIAKHTNYYKENLDFFLYEVAERSLDRTIEALGKDLVAAELEKHRKLKAYAEAKCLDHVVFPCEKAGVPPNPESLRHCYFGDLACGHECAMNAAREYKELWLPPSVSLFFDRQQQGKNLRTPSNGTTEPLPLPR